VTADFAEAWPLISPKRDRCFTKAWPRFRAERDQWGRCCM